METTKMIHRINQYIALLLTAFTTIIVLLLLNFIPNKLDSNFISKNLIVDISLFTPELSEKLQYILGTITFVIGFIIFSKLLSRRKTYKNAELLYKALLIIGFVIVLLLSLVVNYAQPFYLALFWDLHNPVKSMVLIMVMCFIIITAVFIYEIINRKARIFGCLLFAFSIFLIFSLATSYVTYTYFYNDRFVSWHYDAYFYPVYKVYAGYTPLIDFNNLYGFYPYLLVPFFKLTGAINMHRFSMVMAGLVFITLLSLTITVFMLIKNKLLAFVGNLAVVFVIIILPRLYQGKYYLQGFPHRIIFPMLILLICTLLFKIKHKKLKVIIEAIGYIICTLSLIWNIDTGIVVVISYLGFHIFQLGLNYDIKDKKLWFSALKIFCLSMVSVICSFLILMLISFIRSGEIINPSDIIYGQTIFYGLGFYMLRMPLLHPWVLLIIIYMIALAKSLGSLKFVNKDSDEKNESKSVIYFVLAIIGLGSFVYYQGRSHLYVFAYVLWPGILILVLLAEEFIQDCLLRIKNKSDRFDKLYSFLKAAFVLCIIGVISISFMECYSSYMKSSSNSVTDEKFITPILTEVTFGKLINEKVDIISYYAAEIYCQRNDTNIANVPASIDWFTKSDLQKVIDYISKSKNYMIMDLDSYEILKDNNAKQLNQALSHYTLIKQTDKFYLWQAVN